jgi:hypothetical protein
VRPALFARLRRRLSELSDLLDELERDALLAQDVASWRARGGEPSRAGTGGVSDPTGQLATSGRHMRIRAALAGLEKSLRIAERELGWRLDCLDAALNGEDAPPHPRRA